MNNKGYTLLELLLCITIILILVSNIAGTYYNAKQAAKEVRCKAYRKQMELIQSMPEYDYSRNYGEYSDYTSVVDEMILMYNECYKCHPSANNNVWKP